LFVIEGSRHVIQAAGWRIAETRRLMASTWRGAARDQITWENPILPTQRGDTFPRLEPGPVIPDNLDGEAQIWYNRGMTNVSLLVCAPSQFGLAGPNSTGVEATALDANEVLDPLALNPLDEPLPGSICEQFIRCGKLGCHCRTGKLHGPYYYRIWRAGGEVHKLYVKGADVAQVRRQCESYLALSAELRAAMTRAVKLRSRVERQIRRFHSLRQQRLDQDRRHLAMGEKRSR